MNTCIQITQSLIYVEHLLLSCVSILECDISKNVLLLISDVSPDTDTDKCEVTIFKPEPIHQIFSDPNIFLFPPHSATNLCSDLERVIKLCKCWHMNIL